MSKHRLANSDHPFPPKPHNVTSSARVVAELVETDNSHAQRQPTKPDGNVETTAPTPPPIGPSVSVPEPPPTTKLDPPSKPSDATIAFSNPPPVANVEQPEQEAASIPLLATIREFFAQPSWLVSLFFHLALMILLVCISLSHKSENDFSLVHSDTTDVSEEIFELDSSDISETEMVEEFDATVISESPVEALNLSDLEVSQPVAPVSLDVGSESVAEIGKATASMAAAAPKAAANFFGTKAIARSVVFVVDNSNSMGGGKLETALLEMNKAIAQLKRNQKFYIIFYSDTAYPLFHPRPARTLIPATAANKRRTAYWLESVEMCLHTRGSQAIQMARQLRPDLIYLLGDGAFTDKAAKELIGNPIPNAKINTLGMQVKKKDAEAFLAIAKKHGGSYVDVGITAEGKAIFKKAGGRPRNNKKGPIWGVMLKK